MRKKKKGIKEIDFETLEKNFGQVIAFDKEGTRLAEPYIQIKNEKGEETQRILLPISRPVKCDVARIIPRLSLRRKWKPTYDKYTREGTIFVNPERDSAKKMMVHLYCPDYEEKVIPIGKKEGGRKKKSFRRRPPDYYIIRLINDKK